jgi:hypothetical protein
MSYVQPLRFHIGVARLSRLLFTGCDEEWLLSSTLHQSGDRSDQSQLPFFGTWFIR